MGDERKGPSIYSRDHVLNSTPPYRQIGESDESIEARTEAWKANLAAEADKAFFDAERIKAEIEGGAFVDAGGDPKQPLNRIERSALATTSKWLEASHQSRAARIAGVRAERGVANDEMLKQAGE